MKKYAYFVSLNMTDFFEIYEKKNHKWATEDILKHEK